MSTRRSTLDGRAFPVTTAKAFNGLPVDKILYLWVCRRDWRLQCHWLHSDEILKLSYFKVVSTDLLGERTRTPVTFEVFLQRYFI